METRRFGRTEHHSTVAIFGAAALSRVEQSVADQAVENILKYGVNHIDVAPSYGEAELRLGPWMPRIRQDFFVGCKTMERTKEGAEAELHQSLERLQMERFDLYQIHAITTMDELDAATRSGGALEAMTKARQQGLTRFIGITGHGYDTPAIFLEALERFDFDTILYPLNFVQYADPTFRRNSEKLLQRCKERDVGVMIIKSITRGPWGDQEHRYHTWYEPFTDPGDIQAGVNFALSQDVTGLCTVGDTSLLPAMLQACEDFTPLSELEQQALIERGKTLEPLFA